MRQLLLMELVTAAAARHGHTCPSLTYGCRLASIILPGLPRTTPTVLVVRHTSGCLLDGVLEAVERSGLPVRVESRKEPGRCSVEALLPGGLLSVSVRPEVREAVDRLKEGRDLPSFREAGVSLVLGLPEGELAEITGEPPPGEADSGRAGAEAPPA